MAAYVKRAAALLGARVSLVHVVDPASYNGLELYVRPASEVSEEHLGIGRERLDSFLAADLPVAERPRILKSGAALTELAPIAINGRVSLLVLLSPAPAFPRDCRVRS